MGTAKGQNSKDYNVQRVFKKRRHYASWPEKAFTAHEGAMGREEKSRHDEEVRALRCRVFLPTLLNAGRRAAHGYAR